MTKKVEAVKEPKPRMSLKDFYFADRHAEGSVMPIMLPSGDDSGEWLRVIGPDCDEAIKAGRAYTMAYRALQDELSALDASCKEKGNWSEYNDQIAWKTEDLNRQLAVEIVSGWSFDEEFSKDELMALLTQYRGLAEAIAKHHTESRRSLSEK